MEHNEPTHMHQRRIRLADGRYMIFYTFNTRQISVPIKDANEPESGAAFGLAEMEVMSEPEDAETSIR